MARVLVVDDDPSIREVVSMVLSSTGHEVETAEDGRIAISKLEGSGDQPAPASVDLVVLDVMMPGTDGIEVLRWIRAHEWLFDLPVVMLTALDKPDDEASGWFHGCDAYVTKPFDPPDLAANVDAVLEASADLRVMRRRERLADLIAAGARADREGTERASQG